MLRNPLRRAAACAAALAVALGLGYTGTADATPKVCGYVRYGEQPTSTVTLATYCAQPCGGSGAHLPPGQVNGFHYEAFVCVWDI